MSDDQRRELHTLRAKAAIESADAQIVSGLLLVAELMRLQDRGWARDAIHRGIALAEARRGLAGHCRYMIEIQEEMKDD